MKKGFTIVELIIVIVVIGILSGIVILSYGAVQKGVVKTQLSTDLSTVKVAMQTARANTGGFPTSIPASFSASSDITVSYVSGDAKNYCIEAQSSRSPGVSYFLSTADSTTPKQGSCAAASTPLSDVAINGSSATLTWIPQSGATSYDIQYRRNGGAWTSVSSTTSPRVISGLTLSSAYDFQLRTVKPGRVSDWTGSVSRVTLPYTTPSDTFHSCGAYDMNDEYGTGWINATLSWPAASKLYISSYRIEGEPGETYGFSPQTIVNSTGSGTLTAVASSTHYQRGSQGADGTIYFYGVGPNGEKSSVFEIVMSGSNGTFCY